MWRAQLEGLSDIARVVAVDLRGRGKSRTQETSWTIDDHADDVAETLEALGVEQADVGGVSMGGYVALALLRRHPEIVRSLILIDTRSVPDPEKIREGRLRTAALIRQGGVAAMLPKELPRLMAAGASEDLKARAIQMFKDTPSVAGVADTLAMRDRPDSTPLLPEIKVPVLVLQGEQDATIPMAQAAEMAQAIPGAKFVVVPDAGHLSSMENPMRANDAIRAFLH